MKKLVYSPRYKSKIIEIKKYLDIHFGNETRKRVLKEITDQVHKLLDFSEMGVAIKELYGIETEYRYIYVANNYVFYRTDSDCVYIVNIYNEREDYMMKLFGINSLNIY